MTRMENTVLVFVTLICLSECDKGPCVLYPHGCCPHTKWDPGKDECIECPIGFFWENCSKPCPYPLFGAKCHQTCICTQELCDTVNGCKQEVPAIFNHVLFQYSILVQFSVSALRTTPKASGQESSF
uniref:Endothelial cell-specific molecule 1-like n=1 Tax=Crassostrea virginica TaxID=6565 RepID=A0A8B8A9Y9_CRAVI|nr:endothelial cell-specific molecule 1-like [Crassostrea virginica]